MTDRMEEFRARMKRQLDELHKRITELEEMQPHPHEHAISWDTKVGECRRQHLETLARLRDLDAHEEGSWDEHEKSVRSAIEGLRATVEKHEERKSG